MNKLYNALLIVEHLGWKAQLGVDDQFNYLLERCKNLKDEDLIAEELELVAVIDRLLNEKKASLKSDKPSN
jgi:hypothetical protein